MTELVSISIGLIINYLVENPEARKTIKEQLGRAIYWVKNLIIACWNRKKPTDEQL